MGSSENHIFPFLWMRGEEESIICEEMGRIAECGIQAVCVEARPHDGYCRDGWWKDLGIVLKEAKKRDMKVWILDDKHFPTGYANGLIEEKYPERKKLYINSSKADIYGQERHVSLNISRMLKPAIGYWEIGKPENTEERKKNSLLAIIAVKCAEGMELHEEMIDLTDTFDGTNANFKIPAGAWRVHVIYKTRTDGGNEAYINMIDKESAYTQIEAVYEPHFEHLGDEFGKTIAGFFSDEPQFGNLAEMCYDTGLGKKRMPLPWSDELQGMMEGKYGAEYVKYLPFLFESSAEQELGMQVRYDYMDFVSRLYKKNFSDTLGKWCEAHHVEYIGHVVEDNGIHSRFGMGAVHYFRAMSGQHMAGIDCIGGQVVYGGANQGRLGMGESGGDGEFYHYALGKMGASCGHLDPKKNGRTMCELFGAYGWNFGVRDMKYVLDHLLVKGVNYLVPHAFSMADYPDPDCPPHFYARGNNPQFPYFVKLMKYADRMCRLLSGGQHVASVAVLYDGEADWIGGNMPMQKVCRELIENQIDFDIVSIDMLNHLDAYNGTFDGDSLQINGVVFGALVIPYTRAVPNVLAEWIEKAGDFPVLFVGGRPDAVINAGKKGSQKILAESGAAVPKEELAGYLREKRIYDIVLDREYKELSFYHYRKDSDIFVFQNESASERFVGTAELAVAYELMYYNALDDCYEEAQCSLQDGKVLVALELEPAECCVLVKKEEGMCRGVHQSFRMQAEKADRQIDLSGGWHVSMAKAKEYPNFSDGEPIETLTPISVQRPDFAGMIRYTKTVALDSVPKEAYFSAEYVYELMKVTVNGREAGVRMTAPYQVSVAEWLRAGDNVFEIEVTTTPAREQVNYPQPPFDFTYEPVDATGMFGMVKLFIKA